MQEIWIPEGIITLFLLLHIIRPYIKKLRLINGLAWLPLLALLCIAALVPAYGFRPELFPLFFYALILSMISIVRQAKGIKFRSFRETKFILAFFPLLLLIVAGGTAFYFTPQKDPALGSQGVHTLKVTDGIAEKSEYFIRVYTEEYTLIPEKRPLLILVPPALGSLAAVDETAGALRDRGFTVVSYSRRGFDAPAVFVSEDGRKERYSVKPIEWFYRVHAFFCGTVSAAANARGRALEAARKEDILFLLSWVQRNPWLRGTDRLFDFASEDAVYIAGYNEGGSALIFLGDSLMETRTRGTVITDSHSGGLNIRAFIAIESQLWSAFREEVVSIPDIPAGANWFQSTSHGIQRLFMEVKPKKIAEPEQVPQLSTPVLFIVSERVREPKYSNREYRALYRCYNAAQGYKAMTSINDSGPLDYSDFPVRYPLLASLLNRFKRPIHNLDAPAETAAIITQFAESLPVTEDSADND